LLELPGTELTSAVARQLPHSGRLNVPCALARIYPQRLAGTCVP
jgi:hypothetical protein